MTDYAYFHLPDSATYTVVKGETRCLRGLPDLTAFSGFIMAPFRIGGQLPVVVIEADNVVEKPLPKQPEWSKPKIVEKRIHQIYRSNFYSLHSLLDDGTLDKVVLARRSDIKLSQWHGTPYQLFQRACQKYPRQTTVMVCTESHGVWLMSTPELLLARNEERWATMALAGTLYADGDVHWTQKNVREQQFVEEYIEEVIAPFASDIKKTEPYSVGAGKLFHLRTDFSFHLRPGANPARLVEALHPTPAVCGLPKDTAMMAISQHESIDRRYYSGFCGPWNIGGMSRLYVSLRCMELRDEKNVSLYAGGGLLKESTELSEWRETEAKMQTMRSILGSE